MRNKGPFMTWAFDSTWWRHQSKIGSKDKSQKQKELWDICLWNFFPEVLKF